MAHPTAPSVTQHVAPGIGQAAQGDSLPQDLVNAMQGLFGHHNGYRTTHAKGLLVHGKFTPTPQAKTLSKASHFNCHSTEIIARFSVGGGIPHIPDSDVNATPKGLAIRFFTDEGTHSDLISHSFNGFATRTGEDFLTFLKVFGGFGAAQAALKKAQAAGGDTSKAEADMKAAGAAFQGFLGTHASAKKFVESPKPNPHNYGTIIYYEVNTHVLTNKDGKVTNVRYRLLPADGEQLYSDDEVSKMPPNYLEDDLQKRFPAKPIVFTLQAHIADPNDVLDDATIAYNSSTYVDVGKIEIFKVLDDNARKQQEIAFSPSPDLGGVHGIAPSKDPLIWIRKGVYYISVDQRRHQKQNE